MSSASQSKILLIVGTHGDEDIGLEIVKKLKIFPGIKKGDFDVLVGNPRAIKKNGRFIEADLNRVYPGKKDSPVYEEKIAWENLNTARKYDYVFDLHIASKSAQSFVVIPKREIHNPKMVKAVVIDKVVLWPSTSGRLTGPICQFLDNSLEIEFGTYGKTREQAVAKAVQITAEAMRNLLVGSNQTKKETFSQQVFLVYGKFLINGKKSELKLDDFQLATLNGEEYYPLLTNQYLTEGIKCYKMRLANSGL
ncbi:MAG: succinylglutamate desuccinylase/aspartoacylase family protein [Patescibacteria group bacterium]